MSSLRFDSTDLARTEDFLSRTYTKMHLSGRGERTRTRIAREAADSFNIDTAAFDFDVTHEADDPVGRLCLCRVYAGGIERRIGPRGPTGTFGPGDMFVYAPHDRVYGGTTRHARYSIVMLEPELLGRVAAPDPSGAPHIVRLTGDTPLSQAAARQLERVISHVRDNVLAEPSASRAPLVVSYAGQLLAATILATFPYEQTTPISAATDRPALPAALRRAVDYIDAHAAQPITLADITAAAGTTGRALQLAFRRHYDTTPMEYLRRARLDGAHRDLVRADPTSGDTVAGIAGRWGFAPSGRFAALYRREYGVHPSHTLRH